MLFLGSEYESLKRFIFVVDDQDNSTLWTQKDKLDILWHVQPKT